MPDVLVVGAGLAGLACAGDLQAAGLGVRVLDKSRGVSGRASTRRVTLPGRPEAHLDHGARYFTARHERTQALVQAGLDGGWLREWAQGFARWEAGRVTPPPHDGHGRYVAVEGQSMLGRHLADGLDVQTGRTVTCVERAGNVWHVHIEGGEVERAPALVLDLPGPQARALVPEVPAADYDPCWAVGAVLARDLRADWRALELRGHPQLDWIAREHTKRPPGHPPALMLHAGAAWSRANLEREPAEVLPELLAAAAAVLGEEPRVLDAFAHRWRYATPTTRPPLPAHWDAARRLGACGDGFTPDPHGPRVEAALLSGWALVRQTRGTP